jgi:anti-anti-sigma factor
LKLIQEEFNVEIAIRDVNDVKVVKIEGELNTVSSPEAQQQLDQLREQGAKKILLDMTKLDFISSAGLRVLLATAQELKQDGGDLRVCSLNESVKEVFDISGFSNLLMVLDDETEALSGF